jgi:hypothetical protein
MKIYLIGSILLLFTLISCERVIELDLRSAPTQYVIEGQIIADSAFAQVKVTTTKDFQQDNTFPGISGAMVIISSSAGDADTLKEIKPGIYFSDKLRGVQGLTYTLKVLHQGREFNSTSTMPYTVPVEQVKIEEFYFFGDTSRAVVPVFTDPAGKRNFYRFLFFDNDTLDEDINVLSDEFIDGNKNTSAVARPDDDYFPGDKYALEFQCIDQPVYEYYRTLRQTIRGGNAVTPVNPITNIRGGALGYFSAFSVQRFEGIIVAKK